MEPNDQVGMDLREVKRRVLQFLPSGDPLRDAILKEPDTVPFLEGRTKLATWARIMMVKKTRLSQNHRAGRI